jgi:branched-chain amino acid transport system substrate-binding protein
MRSRSLLVSAGLVLAGLLIGLLLGLPSGQEGQAPSADKQEGVATALAPVPEAAQPEGGEQERERALKVGVVGPETGDEAAYGLRVRDGVLMAAKRVNAGGGIGGSDIEVLHFDNKSDPELTLQIVSHLIEQDVVAIFSAPTGWSTFAPTRMANDSRTLFIAVGTRRKIGRSGDYIFHYSLPDEIAIEDLLRYCVNEAKYVDYALVTSSANDYSLSLSSLFKQAVPRHGGRILIEADTYDTFSGQTDLDGVAAALRDSPEPLHAVIYTGNAEEGARLARAARAAGVTAPFIGGEDLFTERFLNEGGEAVRGALLYATFSPHSESPAVAEFMAGNDREDGGVPDRFTALAYDAFTQLAEALRSAGSTKITAVRSALLNGMEAEGVTGKTGWTPDGAPIKHPFIYRVEEDGEGSKFVLLQAGSD